MELKISHLECPWPFGIHKITFLVDEIWWKSLFLAGCILLFSGFVWKSSPQKKTKNPEAWKHDSNSKNMKPATHQYCPQTNHICIRLNRWSTLFTSRWAKIWLCEAIRRSGSASGAPLRLRVTPGTILYYYMFIFILQLAFQCQAHTILYYNK
jgi:hypothetical protein